MYFLEEYLGIGDYGPQFFRLLPGQNIFDEMKKTDIFLKTFLTESKIPEFKGKKEIEFLNYGSTQLVFVATINKKDRYTIVINQPKTTFGDGKKEYDNLKYFSNKNEEVIKPIYYFNKDDKELYIAPYIDRTRCLGVETNKWGMWTPEPVYHFESFSERERLIVNSCMLAKLIKFYDEEKNIGIANIELDGGDFMLDRFAEDYISYSDTINKLRLIAAREIIETSLDNYIELLHNNLLKYDENNIILYREMKSSFTEEEVEKGISLGLELRKNRSK